jgi:hypothetical protein
VKVLGMEMKIPPKKSNQISSANSAHLQELRIKHGFRATPEQKDAYNAAFKRNKMISTNESAIVSEIENVPNE